MASQIDLRGQPNPVNTLSESRKFFVEAQDRPANSFELDPSERTVDGFIELGWDHLQLQRTLHQDFQQSISDWDRPKLEEAAQPLIDEINIGRTTHGAASIEVPTVADEVLRKLIEPKWLDQIGAKDYETVSAKYPEHIKANLDELREVDGKLRLLSEDESLREAANEHSRTQIEAIKAATAWIRTDTRIDDCGKKISQLYQIAASSGRPLTKADKKRIERLEVSQVELRARQGVEITSESMKKPTEKQIERLVRRKRRREFERGLLVTDSMTEIISQVLPSLARGNPALFVGETGGAKTALAKFIAKHYMGKEPELISGYSDVNGYQLMGKTGLNRAQTRGSQEAIRQIVEDEGLKWDELDADQRISYRLEGLKMDTASGATVSDFIAGPVVRAMEAGVPLILDEMNAMPAPFMKRLNEIMQLRPGARMTIQEDSGREVIIKPGFCIVATTNEKSKRYKGIDDLSTELQNRFAASTYRIRYPDHDIADGEVPKENLMLAVAALTDEIGEFAVELPEGQLETFVKVAHITQKLFSGEYGAAERTYVGTDSSADGGPGLNDSVLAPRTMVAILEEVRASYGSIPLDKVVKRWVDGIKNKKDKAVMHSILAGNPLVKPAPAENPNPI